jgi:hypothetical protein
VGDVSIRIPDNYDPDKVAAGLMRYTKKLQRRQWRADWVPVLSLGIAILSLVVGVIALIVALL